MAAGIGQGCWPLDKHGSYLQNSVGLCGSGAGLKEHTTSRKFLCFMTRVELGFPSFFWDISAEYPYLLAVIMLSQHGACWFTSLVTSNQGKWTKTRREAEKHTQENQNNNRAVLHKEVTVNLACWNAVAILNKENGWSLGVDMTDCPFNSVSERLSYSGQNVLVGWMS